MCHFSVAISTDTCCMFAVVSLPAQATIQRKQQHLAGSRLGLETHCRRPRLCASGAGRHRGNVLCTALAQKQQLDLGLICGAHCTRTWVHSSSKHVTPSQARQCAWHPQRDAASLPQVLDVLQMNSGISHQGDLARPRRFMHKLMSGEPLHFGEPEPVCVVQ